jgi:hypothetical protein
MCWIRTAETPGGSTVTHGVPFLPFFLSAALFFVAFFLAVLFLVALFAVPFAPSLLAPNGFLGNCC